MDSGGSSSSRALKNKKFSPSAKISTNRVLEIPKNCKFWFAFA